MLKSRGSKISFFTLGLIAIFAIMFSVISNSKLAASINGPRIVFEQTKHDFGKVASGPQVEYIFRFTNKGNQTLHIEKVQASCGCTGTAMGEKMDYAKGESGEIKVTFNTQGREGKQEKTVMVYSNDSKEPQKVLSFSAEITP
jgi:hypothetical protein